jgi:tetratricopeptide (TPR) repeat protein
MGAPTNKSNRIVAALLAAVWFSILAASQAPAQTAELDTLFERLQEPDLPDWEVVEADIWRLWSRSGSPAMDLLLDRGRRAMEAGDLPAAIEHFTAVTDHAPDFAEGYNMRATAYFLSGLYGPSVVDIQHTLLLNPRHFGALSGFAMILEETDRPKEALEVWRAAQAIHPHSPGINEAVERLTRQESGRDL